ncbi:SIS domain-containing protein [Actinomadura fibrosa]|uniref:SIS domain-containing protein n=1 Tax=Actinomadura fibrosa TaxID=111802 RepID=A0ABW2XR63_9ACTN|nr:sugar isomerase [Actinomadura fibrosa]
MSFISAEIASQPDCWRRAAELAGAADGLPAPGERIAVVGCGTSLFMAQAYAALREASGAGESDAFPASEFPRTRAYDRIVAICRSGTTTEVLDLLRATDLPTAAVIGSADTPITEVADAWTALDFADERSVVQTRFATSALVLLRAHLGALPADLVDQCRAAVAEPLPAGAAGRGQVTFLGTGWTNGIASEAALKVREAAGAWTESYPAMEYRHGPISITDERSLVWFFGTPPDGLADEVRRTTGAQVEASERDALADLVRVQRLAVAMAEAKGMNPDEPRNLTRSIILS